MLNTTDLQKEILRLKHEKGVCILAHAYETHDIIEIADYVGDSFGLSKQAKDAKENTILMCGVRFMAETVKILSPEKKVILSHPDAGCPMAEQLSVDELKRLKKDLPNAKVVAYINTTAALKCECDMCVTSASAVELMKSLDSDEVLFIPDPNLGSFVKKAVPNKKYHFINGGCPVHMGISYEDVANAKAKHPNAKLLVHPECKKEVTQCADYVGSTTGIMGYVKNIDENEFIIGTENSIVEHLKFEYPDKKFYPLSKKCICSDMKLTTLVDVYNCLLGIGGEEIVLDEYTLKNARRAIDNMLN
ncbi:MAG: quinolinate synthase NadA [Clostridia bacterium]|nr:quinolinate synthase NadA [Clostridia bacterium]